MAGELPIGILALQGAFLKHQQMLEKMGVQSRLLTRPAELAGCGGLILPGGESTTMRAHIAEMGFLQPLKQAAERIPFFGTCAGMILMAQNGMLNLLGITVARNAYGRQLHSFATELALDLSISTHIKGIFIRAPRIETLHAPSIKVLAKYGDEPVCIEQGHHLACAFHPELTNDCTLHEYFFSLCKKTVNSGE